MVPVRSMVPSSLHYQSIDGQLQKEDENSFIGHGGGLTFWDGRKQQQSPPQPQQESQEQPQGRRRLLQSQPQEIHYDTRSIYIAFIDRYVLTQPPTTKNSLRLINDCRCTFIFSFPCFLYFPLAFPWVGLGISFL